MKRTPKQQRILDYIQEHGEITKKKATELLDQYYFYNAGHYVQEILSRMVKSKIIERKRRGVYQLRTHYLKESENQTNLF
jgi:hypothetical protein